MLSDRHPFQILPSRAVCVFLPVFWSSARFRSVDACGVLIIKRPTRPIQLVIYQISTDGVEWMSLLFVKVSVPKLSLKSLCHIYVVTYLLDSADGLTPVQLWVFLYTLVKPKKKVREVDRRGQGAILIPHSLLMVNSTTKQQLRYAKYV